MNQKTLKQVAIALFGVIVILIVALIWASGSSGPDLDEMAASTPQVPVAADEAAKAAALADLPRDLNVNTVNALLDDENVVILDVRTASEYASGHVPGAVHLPVDQLASVADQLPDDRPVILTCRTGRRSGQGVDILQDAGLANVVHMDGGMVAWRHAGHEVEN